MIRAGVHHQSGGAQSALKYLADHRI